MNTSRLKINLTSWMQLMEGEEFFEATSESWGILYFKSQSI